MDSADEKAKMSALRRRMSAPCSDSMWQWSEAIDAGVVSVVSQMIDAGMSPDEITVRGFPPIIEAVRGRHLDLARLLVERGSNLNIIDPINCTPLDYAASSAYGPGLEEFCSLLLSAGADPMFIPPRSVSGDLTPFQRITRYGCELSILRLLCEAGADTAFTPLGSHKQYLTPFQQLVRGGQPEVVRYCVDVCGEDPLQRTQSGRSMMQLARDNEPVKQYLRALKSEQVIGARLSADTPPSTERTSAGPGVL